MWDWWRWWEHGLRRRCPILPLRSGSCSPSSPLPAPPLPHLNLDLARQLPWFYADGLLVLQGGWGLALKASKEYKQG